MERFVGEYSGYVLLCVVGVWVYAGTCVLVFVYQCLLCDSDSEGVQCKVTDPNVQKLVNLASWLHLHSVLRLGLGEIYNTGELSEPSFAHWLMAVDVRVWWLEVLYLVCCPWCLVFVH